MLERVTVAQVVVMLGGLGVVVAALRQIWPWISKGKDLVDDLAGERARPGVPERPGVMVRLENVEQVVARIDYHSRPNNGGSAHDELTGKLDDLGDRLKAALEDAHQEHLRTAHHITELAHRMGLELTDPPD